MANSASRSPTTRYDANYGEFQTELYAEIRREAFGEDIGQNSWLTSDEHDKFLEWLDLGPGENPAGCGVWSRRPGIADCRYHRLFGCRCRCSRTSDCDSGFTCRAAWL